MWKNLHPGAKVTTEWLNEEVLGRKDEEKLRNI